MTEHWLWGLFYALGFTIFYVLGFHRGSRGVRRKL